MQEKTSNKMREGLLEKVTVNMGVGQAGDELEKAAKIMELITGAKPIRTLAKIKQPTWGLREGLPIGVKVTLRGKAAHEFLERALLARDKKLPKSVFDNRGNFGFGVKEHIDLPKIKYDPKLGIKGFDVLVTLKRRGYRIKRRKLAKCSISHKHMLTNRDAMDFMKNVYGVEVA
jgi:large subunit ribosomal protein L5